MNCHTWLQEYMNVHVQCTSAYIYIYVYVPTLQGKGHPPATPTGLGPSSSTDNLTSSSGAGNNVGGASTGGGTPQGESAPIRAPLSLWRCSRIMHLLRDLHPTLLSALEGIVDQVHVYDIVQQTWSSQWVWMKNLHVWYFLLMNVLYSQKHWRIKIWQFGTGSLYIHVNVCVSKSFGRFCICLAVVKVDWPN